MVLPQVMVELFTMRGLGLKGFAGFTLDTSTGGTLGYHYEADAEL